MKITKLILQNFKSHEYREIRFEDDLTLIIGNNGTGKSSILQAVAAMLGTATGEFDAPSQLQWAGYEYAFASSFGHTPYLKATVTFTREELKAIKELFEAVNLAGNLKTIPGNSESAILALDYQTDKVTALNSSLYHQFKGNSYAKSLGAKNISFKRVGGIYWYTEERNSRSFKGYFKQFEDEFDNIRFFLSQRELFHQKVQSGMPMRDGDADVYEILSQRYSQIFSDTRFVGSRPRINGDAFLPSYFFLEKNGVEYEVSEMSAGERAIFPLLVDFANFSINNSIILIDEIELHLHPPLQQSLLYNIQRWGENNQFIITTHSDYVAEMIPNDQKRFL